MTSPLVDRSRSRQQLVLGLAVLSSVAAVAIVAMRWHLEFVLFVALAICGGVLFVISSGMSVTWAVQGTRRVGIVALVPLLVNLAGAGLAAFVPWHEIAKARWFRGHEPAMQEVVQGLATPPPDRKLVETKEVDTTYEIVDLDAEHADLSDTRKVVVKRHGGDVTVLFFQHHFLLGGFDGFAYSPQGEPIMEGMAWDDWRVEVMPAASWYFVRGGS